MHGLLLILSGPSGCGKSTVIKRLNELVSGLRFSVSCTTRSPRPGEVNGVHYYFCTPQEFQEKQDAGEMLEYAHVHTASYGTPKAPAIEAIHNGEIMILDIDVQGARQVKAALDNTEYASALVRVFLAPPSLEELERRLRSRGTETEAAIETRLKNAATEMACADEYQYQVVNDQVENAAQALKNIITEWQTK